ncbi:MAG: hypothetical protein HY913_23435 [Desulfomonile tiedjei]|nr:hypothetical protein [Desulfomonile tiedjei]
MVEINDLFDAILKRAEEAKANGIKPRLSRSTTEYYITIPQGYKTRLYKVIIIKGSKGITIQTYDRGKMQFSEKLPDATFEDVMKKLPLDFIIISGKDDPEAESGPRRGSDS